MRSFSNPLPDSLFNAEFEQDGNLINIPLFLADKTKELLKDKS
jgi:hypothetical protein